MALVKVYVNLILNGRKTLEDVPAKLRLAVETELEKHNEEGEL